MNRDGCVGAGGRCTEEHTLSEVRSAWTRKRPSGKIFLGVPGAPDGAPHLAHLQDLPG